MQPYLVKDAVALPPFAGNQSRFAEAIETTQQNVSNWVRKEQSLPAEYVLRAEAATGIPRTRWRPDIYPAEQPTPAEQEARAA